MLMVSTKLVSIWVNDQEYIASEFYYDFARHFFLFEELESIVMNGQWEKQSFKNWPILALKAQKIVSSGPKNLEKSPNSAKVF